MGDFQGRSRHMGKEYPSIAVPEGRIAAGVADVAREQVEFLVENDPALVPRQTSALLVESAVLDPEEVRALLRDLDFGELTDGDRYESHASPSGRRRGHPELPAPARLFADDAGTGGPA